MRRVLLTAAVAGLLLPGAASARLPAPRPPQPSVRVSVDLPPSAALAPAAPGAAQRGWGSRSAGAAGRITRMAGLERQVLAAINDLRRDRGLTPLRLNSGLSTAAREHSISMAEHGFFRHASHDKSPFWKRVKEKYPPLPGRYWGVGENMVWASPALSADQALEMWLKSPPHRKNLLTPAWRDIGLGAVGALHAPGVYEGRDVTIVTADFGVRGS